MKNKRTYIFIAISSVALISVLIIQVNWIFETARIKARLFNEKANLVLSRTIDALAADKETCQKINACMQTDSSAGPLANLGKDEANKIDSLFRYYMKFYNFYIDYSFVLTRPKPIFSGNQNHFSNHHYKKQLEQIAGNNTGIELKLVFPEKRQFIMAEMGLLFITSVVLILVVLLLFWRTVSSLIKEKQIYEHTSDFLNNMTHEFKTPLTNIALAGKMMNKGSTLKQEDKLRHYSGIILQENEKLRLQVEQVLSMTALERGEIPLQKKRIDIHSLITECVAGINIQIENKYGKITLLFNAQQTMIYADQAHLTNALSNIIDNAIKYSTQKPELTIHTTNNNGHVIITIADKGIGIAKQYHNIIFDKYFRVPAGDVHDVKGFGLGLAYVKKIIELHGGSIGLESEKGEGSAFTITLPHA